MVALASALAAACASVPALPASDWLARQARSFTQPPGKANVYVTRGKAYLADQALWTIDLDFRGFGTLAGESYLYGWIPPGDHVLAVLQDGQVHGLRFRAAAGASYFFTVSAGLLTMRIDRLDEGTGRELVGRYVPSGDNRFEGEPVPPLPAARREDR